tara:strand:- start:1002 stop:1682 length:681 start_codon:yes stop_codon:yes gene_type:complete
MIENLLIKTLYICYVILDEDIAKKTSELLLQINAIKFNHKNPFTWASGWKSPIYCDNRIILSYPKIRKYISENLSSIILKKYPETELIAGVATGAIGIGMLVAEELNKPFVYVRSNQKVHGRKNSIEGYFKEGAKVVVIEDLISTGGSSLKACNSLKNEGLSLLGMISIFNYDFEISKKNFLDNNIDHFSLSSFTYLLNYAEEEKFFNSEEMKHILSWRDDPANWI